MIFIVFYSFLIINISSSIEVAGGEFAKDHEFPHLLSVFTYKSGTNFHYCTASLLNANTAILAAHCFDNIQNPKQLYVQGGTNDVSKMKNGDMARVVDAKLHPHWDKKKIVAGKLINDHDVAVIYLDKNLTEDGVNFRYLDLDDDINLPIGVPVTIAGWGYYVDGSHKRDYKMRKIQIPVQPYSTCQDCNDTIMICAGDGVGKDSCHGDSGSALVRLPNGTDTKRWKAVGVVSFGPSGCGRIGSYGVYTRLAFYSKWIWSVAKKPPPPKDEIPVIAYLDDYIYIPKKSCFKVNSGEEGVCNGHGKCLEIDYCECDIGWTGNDCGRRGIAGVTVEHVEVGVPIFFSILMCCVTCCCLVFMMTCLCCCCFIKMVFCRGKKKNPNNSEDGGGFKFIKLDNESDHSTELREFDEEEDELDVELQVEGEIIKKNEEEGLYTLE